ncbi:MAG: hypothetical protein HOY69_03430 [Streptomyces sp.]|nr:hypothetical protein [Streptomyces sp.]
MISEPEMSDETGGGAPPGDLLADSGEAPAAVRQPRPWVWALGGIAVASAVWAAALHGTGDGTAPDLHGYHLDGNPCADGTLASLKDAVGVPDFAASDATVTNGPALDELSCVLMTATASDQGWATSYTVSVTVELHKKTDPRAEFENARHTRVLTLPGGGANGNAAVAVAGTGTDATSAADVHPVAGVGDEAYLLTPSGSGQTLEVLNGGAVLTLQVSGYTQWNSSGAAAGADDPPVEPDLTRLRPAMTTAMRHLMTSLSS